MPILGHAAGRWALGLVLALAVAAPAKAQLDPPPPGFEAWLGGVRAEALAQGLDARTVEAALRDVRPIPRIIELDRRQAEFSQTFWGYISRAVSDDRVVRGKQLLAAYRPLLEQVRQRYGVQPRFLVALWGLESNYGDNTGGFHVIHSLVTLAFDERRSDLFRAQLFDALRILQERAIPYERMTGSWAGAMGQVQFMPSTFRKFAVDFNGDGRRDIWETMADAFASAANYLHDLGWQGNQTWGREVRLPASFDLTQASLDVRRSMHDWQQLGVRDARGGPLPAVEVGGSIVVPGGHKGPAFLVYENYRTILEWNRSLLYALAVGILSDRLEDKAQLVAVPAPGERPLSRAEVEEMQNILVGLGYDVGDVDGVVGAQTRAALKSFQASRKLPPDGFASPEMLDHLRRAKSP